MQLNKKYTPPLVVDSFLQIPHNNLPKIVKDLSPCYQFESLIFLFVSYQDFGSDYYIILKENNKLYLIETIDPNAYNKELFLSAR